MLAPREMYLFKLAGTRFQMRPSHIPANLIGYGAMIAYARALRPRNGWLGAFQLGTGWFIVAQVVYVLHSLGHILSARAADVPMDAVVLENGRHRNIYNNHHVTDEQHIARAAGGPALNAAAGLGALPVWAVLRNVPYVGEWVAGWIVFNAAGVTISMLPMPSVDGAALIRHSVTRATGDFALGREALQQLGVLAIIGFAAMGVLVWVLPVQAKFQRSGVLFGLAGLVWADTFISRRR